MRHEECNPSRRIIEAVPARVAAEEHAAAGSFEPGAEVAVVCFPAGKRRDVLGAEGCVAGSEGRRGAGADRAERSGEDDAAEGVVANYAADDGVGGDSWAGGEPAGSGNRISSGIDGAGERVFERGDPGDGKE